jgi:hypothetical protein
MGKRFALMIASIAFGVAQLVSSGASHAGDADDNVRAMMEAARSLKFSERESRAYMPEKEASTSQVAVIFGYADNKAACEQIAGALTESLAAGPLSAIQFIRC